MKSFKIRHWDIKEAALEHFFYLIEGEDEGIIASNSVFRKNWDRIIYLSTLFTLIVEPFVASFQADEQGAVYTILSYLVDLLFVVNIVLNFQTSYIDQDRKIEIFDQSEITDNYMRGWFIVDLLGALPGFAFYPFSIFGSAVSLLLSQHRLLRCFYLFRLEFFDLNAMSSCFKLVQMLAIMFLSSHWFTCVWYSIVKSQTGEDTWLHAQGLADKSTASRYISILYASLGMLTGDNINPVTDFEKQVAMLSSVFASILEGAIFGNIALIIQRVNAAAIQREERLENIGMAMRMLKLPDALQQRIIYYHRYCYEHQLGDAYDDFIGKLSTPLQLEVGVYRHLELLKKSWLFEKCEPAILLQVVSRLVDSTFLPGDYILRINEKASEMYLIVKGKCAVIDSSDENNMVRELVEGAYFGEVALLLNQTRTASVRAITYCTLAKLTKDAFDEISEQFPEYAKYMAQGLKQYEQPESKDQTGKPSVRSKGFTDQTRKSMMVLAAAASDHTMTFKRVSSQEMERSRSPSPLDVDFLVGPPSSTRLSPIEEPSMHSVEIQNIQTRLESVESKITKMQQSVDRVLLLLERRQQPLQPSPTVSPVRDATGHRFSFASDASAVQPNASAVSASWPALEQKTDSISWLTIAVAVIAALLVSQLSPFASMLSS
eukprot:GILK01011583.1.p1 GENE.GILK01011583.1~~GILK01011583.1.p1  ORF type:complete len:765 (-),score=84.69 GILK01011583.1:143-2122(-)